MKNCGNCAFSTYTGWQEQKVIENSVRALRLSISNTAFLKVHWFTSLNIAETIKHYNHERQRKN